MCEVARQRPRCARVIHDGARRRNPCCRRSRDRTSRVTRFDHERIPARVVHARGSGARARNRRRAPVSPRTTRRAPNAGTSALLTAGAA
ncbi:MAG: catalase [Planctomycetota bacterium]